MLGISRPAVVPGGGCPESLGRIKPLSGWCRHQGRGGASTEAGAESGTGTRAETDVVPPVCYECSRTEAVLSMTPVPIRSWLAGRPISRCSAGRGTGCSVCLLCGIYGRRRSMAVPVPLLYNPGAGARVLQINRWRDKAESRMTECTI